MPLLLLCGYPCSGKTALAERLRAHFASQGRACVVVAEAHSASFNTTATEDKTARSALRSEVQRLLSQTTLVIVDAANEVKGFRYELFCLARACKTPHAVLHVATPLEACIARCTAQIVAQENSEGQAHGQTERQIQTQAEAELSESQTQAASAITVPSSVGLQEAEEWLRARAARFEPPDSRNRWDSPLFTLAPEDELPLQALAAALYERQAPPPHASTRGQPLTDTNFIHELDSTTQEIVAVGYSIIMHSTRSHFDTPLKRPWSKPNAPPLLATRLLCPTLMPRWC